MEYVAYLTEVDDCYCGHGKTPNEAYEDLLGWVDDEYFEDHNTKIVKIAEKIKPSICDFINIDDMVDRIAENAYDDGGEYAEDYLYNLPSEQREELERNINTVLLDWAKKYNHEPNWFHGGKVVEERKFEDN
jgi:hypothetical protein